MDYDEVNNSVSSLNDGTRLKKSSSKIGLLDFVKEEGLKAQSHSRTLAKDVLKKEAESCSLFIRDTPKETKEKKVAVFRILNRFILCLLFVALMLEGQDLSKAACDAAGYGYDLIG
ncbi:hypothetical protein Tco_0958265 [Tanacetum coccineum]